MMNDTVREELQTKITSGRLLPRPASPARIVQAAAPAVMRIEKPPAQTEPRPSTAVAAAMPMMPLAPRKQITADLTSTKTSPTIVGFQNKNATLPEWRLQLQNAVQQRKSATDDGALPSVAATAGVSRKGISGLRPESQSVASAIAAPVTSDPRVLNALRRINESRSTFLETEKKAVPSAKPVTGQYKFDVVAKNPVAIRSTAVAPNAPKPRLVAPPPIIKRDTNKLPPIEFGQNSLNDIDATPIEAPAMTASASEFAGINRIHIRAEHPQTDGVAANLDIQEEIEDLALFSTRFAAGLFDLIISAFVTMLLLLPVALTRNDWFSAVGLLTFAGTFGVVMFLYMTICLGFYGKTMGMRLFSLELVDAVENEYPTLHQAAVSSSVFILSLALGGAGFLTVFYNEEKRAAHDLLSGTILVREF